MLYATGNTALSNSLIPIQKNHYMYGILCFKINIMINVAPRGRFELPRENPT